MTLATEAVGAAALAVSAFAVWFHVRRLGRRYPLRAELTGTAGVPVAGD